MIKLDTTYEKELIPGLRQSVDRAVERRLSQISSQAHEKSPSFLSDSNKDQIREAYQKWSATEVYAQCPFSGTLSEFPGLSDWTALGEFSRRLHKFTNDQKEMNAWANAVIEAIKAQLWPKKSILG